MKTENKEFVRELIKTFLVIWGFLICIAGGVFVLVVLVSDTGTPLWLKFVTGVFGATVILAALLTAVKFFK